MVYNKGTELDLFGGLTSALSAQVTTAIEELSTATGNDSRGAIYTRTEVVDFILDLVGYTVDKPLYKFRLLEPSFGGGDFLLSIVERLLTTWKLANNHKDPLYDLGNAIRAVELHYSTYEATNIKVIELLKREGLSHQTAIDISNRWLIQGDFLLTPLDTLFEFVVGNPPYVRQESIPAPLLAEYRNRYQTLYDRADLYVPFIEHSLSLLAKGGKLGFICSDRWMKNRYGGPLRDLVHNKYHLKIYVDMVDTPAFQSDVIAYPAITIISKEPRAATRIARRPMINRVALSSLAEILSSVHLQKDISLVREQNHVTNGNEPWLLESSVHMDLIRRLEQQYPTLEEAGCKVGIGVATGADNAFIDDFDTLDVEDDCKLPLVTTKDIVSGEVKWQGLGVINPFHEDGGLLSLKNHPRLSRYLEDRRDIIAGRHCAQKTPTNWYRTIDRIIPTLATTAKLLIPDIKGEAHIVFEEGKLYPHHNLYYVLSDTWDLRALQAVLLSAITRLFVATYSIKMRGGCLRFQAQYLRRIRIPLWVNVTHALRIELANAATKRDLPACNCAVSKLYRLSYEEQVAIGYKGE